MTCSVTVKNEGNATQLADDTVTNLKVLLYKGSSPVEAKAVACGGGTVVAVATANLTTSPGTTCNATYDLDAADQTAKTVSLQAIAYGVGTNPATAAPTTASSPTAVTLKGSLTVPAATLAVSTTPVTADAPAAANAAVNITFKFRNTGPVAVTGITLTAPAVIGMGAMTSCDATSTASEPGPTAATADTECTVTYTVQAGDGANAVKSLTFGLAVTDTNLGTAWAIPTVVVDIPVVRTFTTSFAATDCSVGRTSTAAGQCKQGYCMSKWVSTPA